MFAIEVNFNLKKSFKTAFLLLSISCLFLLNLSCSQKKSPEKLIIFSAAGMTPILDHLKSETQKNNSYSLELELSGSHLACRKISEFNRYCDIIITADQSLFKAILKDHLSFRLDFATDEIVLAFGKFAKFADEAEQNPLKTILTRDVKLGRTDETLSPLGYMAFFACLLAEQDKPEEFRGLLNTFKAKSSLVTDDVMQLIPHLKAGQIDYALIFKSTCIANEIRFTTIPEKYNLSSLTIDYSGAKLADIPKKGMTSIASPIIFSASIPKSSQNFQSAVNFLKILCSSQKIPENGFGQIQPPQFYGDKTIFDSHFANFAIYAGSEF